jgi:hypothetical protein
MTTTTLSEHGLSPIGTWNKGAYATVAHLRDQCLFGLTFDLPKAWHTRSNVVYAFVVGEVVLYIGETTNGLASRFAGYRYGNPSPADTDNRIKLALSQALSNDQAVTIWATCPVATLALPDGSLLHVPASKPLEEHLIGTIRPELNVKSLYRPTVVT